MGSSDECLTFAPFCVCVDFLVLVVVEVDVLLERRSKKENDKRTVTHRVNVCLLYFDCNDQRRREKRRKNKHIYIKLYLQD